MWNCPKCVKPQTLLDQVLKFEDYWQQVYFVPYSQIYQHTSVHYEGMELSLFFNSLKSRLTIIRVQPIVATSLECHCGATLPIQPVNARHIFFKAIQFFKKVIVPLPAPHIESCETLVRFAEDSHPREREAVVRDYILRHVRRSYLGKQGEDTWVYWFRP